MILPNTISKGLITAPTPSNTAITFLTGLGNLPKALATVLIPLARVEITGAKASPNSIAEFLISLKAGGTGLNLTGADVVIHYDPWWNLSAENQATDRTYRIGQKNNVQVYKLITKNSIEEKIYELQQKKAKLADNMLSTQNTFINQLSKEDIMKLFG